MTPGAPPVYEHTADVGARLVPPSSNESSSSSSSSSSAVLHRSLSLLSTPPPFPPLPPSPLSVDGGTHYAYIYVGTPPQLQSVILDTGSHFTAFPCIGCGVSCGKSHLDRPFDYTVSKTAKKVRCDSCEHKSRAVCDKDDCVFEQAYAEGSTWEAVQFEDLIYVWGGEDDAKMNKSAAASSAGAGAAQAAAAAAAAPARLSASSYAVDFVFGCHRKETGLFALQKADGIMGLAMHESGLMRHLVDRTAEAADEDKSSARSSAAGGGGGGIVGVRNMFSLCFTPSGGVLSLGGSDPSLHVVPMQYARLANPTGWFQVPLVSVFLNEVLVSSDRAAFQSGKGTIVDSGTTDTYLPFAIGRDFKKVWKDVTGGGAYANSPRPCEEQDLEKLPTLWLVFEGGQRWGVGPREYMEVDETTVAGNEHHKKKKMCVPRIYLDEDKGAVIGANAMLYKDVLFDEENLRVGWATSKCGASS